MDHTEAIMEIKKVLDNDKANYTHKQQSLF